MLNQMSNYKVSKKVLKNGLTVLVRPTHQIPKVSVQLWYNVGSKDEKSGEKGIAHLIEHMIFKGTKDLTESDINLITHKLSGYCNAFTSYDYTGYLFDFPTHHWQEALPIMADCMKNCTFKQNLLNSELKAVIQELKMYKDDYQSSIVEELITTTFAGHPYQHPIIGYKNDLWNLNRENLVNFYQKHYIPNNAILIVVGDVSIDEVFTAAEENFGQIAPNLDYKKEEYYLPSDLVSKSVTLYRDVQQTSIILSYMVPGARDKVDYVIDIISWILGSGRSSRLYIKLVEEKKLVTEIDTFSDDLFDKGLFFIYFVPNEPNKVDEIINIIQEEIDLLAKYGPTQKELNRAIKKTETDYLTLLENNQKQAYVIGKFYLSNGDENYIFNYLSESKSNLKELVQEILKKYFRFSSRNIGKILPMLELDKDRWLQLQEISDKEDEKVLSLKSREGDLELGNKVKDILTKDCESFNFPKAERFVLKNGLEVMFYHNNNLPKIDLVLDLKAKYFYDPQNLQGLFNFTSSMLLEGTKKYKGIDLADTIESLGINVNIFPGHISMGMLSEDFEQGLELLKEIITESVFDTDSIEKVRGQIISDIKNYWDDPSQFVGQIVSENVYKNHPYSKDILGSIDTVKKISRDDLISCYKKFISPDGARLSIVGDLSKYNIKNIIDKIFSSWHSVVVEDLSFSPITPAENQEIDYYINRDQVVLCFAAPSVKRFDNDYDKLLIFDQIFTGGVLGSMSSRLFKIREQSGLFYTIGGSLIFNSGTQPGMIFIKTIVSLDRLKEAEKLIKNTIDKATDFIDPEEFIQAKNGIVNSLVDNFESNKKIANSFLFLSRYKLSGDFFDTRASQLSKISIEETKESVKKFLDSSKMLEVKIGRVGR